jgi:ATP-binding cassette subfamily B (MDR/TAP) protein 1
LQFRKVDGISLLARLFWFADNVDYALISIGILAAIGNGMALPVFTLFFKDLVNGGFGDGGGTSADQVTKAALGFLYLSIALTFSGTLASGSLLWSAARQGAAMRTAYLRSILRQDVAWFDAIKTGELTASLERDCANVQGAIGEKV